MSEAPPGLQAPRPVYVTHLFPDLLGELTGLLAHLDEAQWGLPTACGGWTVKDVALHLLGVEVGNLSYRRDGFNTAAGISGWDELVAFLDEFNQSWVRAARRLSPRLLIDLLQFTGGQVIAYYQALDPEGQGEPVSWVGPDPVPIWLDLAREYTERWHHQQHIRDAVDKPGLKEPKYMGPALAAFARALPRALAGSPAPEGAAVTLTVSGPAGGQWTALRAGGGWTLYAGAPEQPAAEAQLDEDSAWRLFTRGLSRAEAEPRVTLQGDPALGAAVFEMVSIIA